MSEVEKLPHTHKQGLVVAHVVEVCYGGIATFVRELLQSQLNDPAIAQVHLIADPNVIDMDLKGLVQNHFYKSSRNPYEALAIARAIDLQLQKICPDAVYLHSTFPGAWGRMYRRRRWAIIYCAHGWSFAQHVDWIRRLFYKMAESFLSRRCDAVVSISQDEYNQAVAAGVKAPIHEVILHGVPPSSPVPIDRLERAADAIHLAFVGRFDRQKGVDILFEIFADPRLDHIHIWFVGRAVHAQDIDFPRRSNFHFLGWRRGGEVDAVLSQMDGLIMPSRWEGFGLSALEAMRNGKAVIANRVGGLGEIVIDKINGRFIDIRDIAACRDVLLSLDEVELNRMGAEGLKTYRTRFSWDRTYRSWQMLLSCVVRRA